MNMLDILNSKITYENKTIFGVIGIILGLIYWVRYSYIYSSGFILIFILFNLPNILLIIPNPKIKNNKILAIISTIILLLLLIFYTTIMFDRLFFIFTVILIIYGLFCAYLLTIQTEPNQINAVSNNTNMPNNTITTFDKYCSECGHGLMNDAKFCPGCGRKLNPTVGESTVKEDEKDELKCKNCGTELNEKHIFCPECGEKIKD